MIRGSISTQTQLFYQGILILFLLFCFLFFVFFFLGGGGGGANFKKLGQAATHAAQLTADEPPCPKWKFRVSQNSLNHNETDWLATSIFILMVKWYCFLGDTQGIRRTIRKSWYDLDQSIFQNIIQLNGSGGGKVQSNEGAGFACLICKCTSSSYLRLCYFVFRAPEANSYPQPAGASLQ